MASSCLQAETLAVYLDQPLPGVEASFREELRTLLRSSGFGLELRNYNDRKPNETFDRLMVVQLRGRCSAESLPTGVMPGPLASTQVQGDRVLPFAEVFCERTLATIGGWLQKEPVARRNLLLGKALARVLAHEAYHFLTQDTGHTQGGVAKECFHTRDLLADRFQFDAGTVARLQAMTNSGGEVTGSETEEAAER